MAHEERKLWTSQYVRGFTATLGVHLVFVILMSYMAIYAAQYFAAGSTAAGFAASSFVIGASLARLFIGKYIDFVGRRTILLWSLVLFIACSIAYMYIDWFWLLIVNRLLHGVAFGIASTTLTMAVIGLIPFQRLSEGIGYFSLSGTLAHTVGPLLAIQLSVRASSTWVFVAATICAAIALLVALRLKIHERAPTAAERQRWRTVSSRDLVDMNVLPVVLVVLVSSLSYSVLITYLPPYLVGMGLANTASIFFSVWALATLVVRVIAGRLQDRYGENAVIPAALAMMAIGITLLAFSDSLLGFILAAVVGGLGHGAVAPSLQAVGIKRTTSDRLATATSSHYLGLDLGLAIGPVMLGFLITVLDYSGLYLVAAAILLVNILLYWLVHGRRASTY